MTTLNNTYMVTTLRQRQIEIKYVLITVGLFISLVMFSRTAPGLMVEQEFAGVMQFVIEWGAIGVVLFAFAANAAYFVNIPYTILMLVVAATYNSSTGQFWLAVATGLGAATGASVSYLALGKLAQLPSAQPNNGIGSRLSQLIRKYPRLAPAVVFLGAVTPLPDDPIFAYLALTGYPLRKLALPLFTGKVIHTLTMITLLDLIAPDQLEVGFASMFPLLILTLVFVLYQIEKANRAS